MYTNVIICIPYREHKCGVYRKSWAHAIPFFRRNNIDYMLKARRLLGKRLRNSIDIDKLCSTIFCSPIHLFSLCTASLTYLWITEFSKSYSLVNCVLRLKLYDCVFLMRTAQIAMLAIIYIHYIHVLGNDARNFSSPFRVSLRWNYQWTYHSWRFSVYFNYFHVYKYKYLL